MTKKIFVIAMIVLLACASVFAEGVKEEAYQEGYDAAYQAGYDAGLAFQEPKTTTGSAGVTRPMMSGKQVAYGGTATAAVGNAILERGGNAFDAAIAMAAAQGFAEPTMNSFFGSDAAIMVYDAKTKEVTFYNGTGWAGNYATPDFYLDMGSIPHTGPFASQIPGEFSGWMQMAEEKCSMSLAEIFEPVVELARDGLVVNDTNAGAFKSGLKTMVNDYGKSLMYDENGNILEFGSIYKNVDYAKTCELLGQVAAEGATIQEGFKLANEYFYRGPIAEKMVEVNNSLGGLWTLDDFHDFNAEKMAPLHTTFMGYDVWATANNCQGNIAIEALNMIECFDLTQYEHNSAEYIDLITQVLNLALNDRNLYNTDHRFFEMPEYILTKEYAKYMVENYIHLGTPMTTLPKDGLAKAVDYEAKSHDTTYFAVADKEGNIVSVVHSTLTGWGAGVAIDGYGIVLNNRMSYFSLDEEHVNVVAPHKRTMQTIAPGIVTKDGEPYIFYGTPGADVQEQCKFQVLLNYLVFGFNPQKAVEQPRIVTALPGGPGQPDRATARLQVSSVGTEVRNQLIEMGYDVVDATNTGSVGLGVYNNGFWMVGVDPQREAYCMGR